MCSLRFESIRKHWIMIIFILVFLIGSSEAVSSAEKFDSVIYSGEQLLGLLYTAMSSVPRMDIPVDLRRRRRVCRAGVKRRLKKRQYKPSLPVIIMVNVRSLGNKMEELTTVTILPRTQWEYRDCSFMFY